MDKITFITSNASKAEQLSKYLNIDIKHQKVDLPEIQSLDLAEIIEQKAKEAFKVVGTPVIVDDVSLIISSMGKLPGPFIKFFISEISNTGICKIAASSPDKSALAQVCIGYYDGNNIEICSGYIKGKISDMPKGSGGFGWDQIFIPEGYSQTRAEMSDTDYDATNPRKFALEKLQAYFESQVVNTAK